MKLLSYYNLMLYELDEPGRFSFLVFYMPKVILKAEMICLFFDVEQKTRFSAKAQLIIFLRISQREGTTTKVLEKSFFWSFLIKS